MPSPSADLRNPLAKARDAWLEGEEGQICAGGVATGTYLTNRLELAFIAGWDAAERYRRNRVPIEVALLRSKLAALERVATRVLDVVTFAGGSEWTAVTDMAAELQMARAALSVRPDELEQSALDAANARATGERS